jgi:hypothetical protein
MDVHRPALIYSDDGESVISLDVPAVWDTGVLLSGTREGIARQVKEALDDLITKFSAAYYKAN